MAAVKKSYLLAPNFTFRPDGPIALGNIVADPLAPDMVLTSPDPKAKPKGYTALESPWSLIQDKQKAGGFGVWTRFLQIAGIKAELTLDHEVWKQYKIATMETSYLYPTDEEITERTHDTKVKRVLESGILGSSVYMVTGIKIARGFVAKSKDNRGRTVYTEADADLSLVTGVPVGVGANAQSKSSGSEHIELKAEQDIVFAYQLRKIIRKGRNKNVVVKSKEYLPKATFLNNNVKTTEEAKAMEFELEQHDVAQPDLLDLHDGDIEFNIIEVEEDGESCVCISL